LVAHKFYLGAVVVQSHLTLEHLRKADANDKSSACLVVRDLVSHLPPLSVPQLPRINRHGLARFVFDLYLLKNKRHIFQPATIVANILPEV
jgi:hypothetical protein